MEPKMMTREEALRRFKDSKKKKEEFVKKVVEEAREEFRLQNGQYPKYVEVW